VARTQGPAPDAGYYSGNPPRAGGTGSGAGPKGLRGMKGMKGGAAGGEWHPTVRYLLVLVVVEIILMGAMRQLTRHGG
jgi:hypothetical protein